MYYYCDVCDKKIQPKSKYKHSKPKSLKKCDKCKGIILSLKDIDINDVDEAFYLHIIEHNEKFD